MAWVVKAWKPEALAAAERQARRVRRATRRETADAGAYLRVLEELGGELRDDVRAHRRKAPPEPAPGEITARKGRATLHDSPLGELFKSTR